MTRWGNFRSFPTIFTVWVCKHGGHYAIYNFEVAHTHTYFVGTEGVLVHNAYSAATVETIKATLGANANKWTSFVDRVVRMNVPIAQRAKLYDEISKITNQGDLVKFLDEFEAIEAFRKGIVDDIDLISVWNNISATIDYKKSYWCNR